MYVLTSTNLTQLGGPMGSERTTTNWRRYFVHRYNAEAIAQNDYRDHLIASYVRYRRGRGESEAVARAAAEAETNEKMEKFKWINERGYWRTPDLGFVMYSISPIKAEDEDA